MILLDTVYQSLYLIMARTSETTEWHRIIRAAAIDSGISLEDQQLTKDDIPVIVEKCVNFVYAHGTYLIFVSRPVHGRVRYLVHKVDKTSEC